MTAKICRSLNLRSNSLCGFGCVFGVVAWYRFYDRDIRRRERTKEVTKVARGERHRVSSRKGRRLRKRGLRERRDKEIGVQRRTAVEVRRSRKRSPP